MRVSARIETGLGQFVAASGGGAIMSGWALLAYQSIHWLLRAPWISFDLGSVLPWLGLTTPQFRWPVARGMIETSLGAPLSVVLFASGAVSIWCGIALIVRAERSERLAAEQVTKSRRRAASARPELH